MTPQQAGYALERHVEQAVGAWMGMCAIPIHMTHERHLPVHGIDHEIVTPSHVFYIQEKWTAHPVAWSVVLTALDTARELHARQDRTQPYSTVLASRTGLSDEARQRLIPESLVVISRDDQAELAWAVVDFMSQVVLRAGVPSVTPCQVVTPFQVTPFQAVAAWVTHKVDTLRALAPVTVRTGPWFDEFAAEHGMAASFKYTGFYHEVNRVLRGLPLVTLKRLNHGRNSGVSIGK